LAPEWRVALSVGDDELLLELNNVVEAAIMVCRRNSRNGDVFAPMYFWRAAVFALGFGLTFGMVSPG